jgi:hypothetical protein
MQCIVGALLTGSFANTCIAASDRLLPVWFQAWKFGKLTSPEPKKPVSSRRHN